MTDRTSTYRVGRGHPPEHSRWKKGQSGNPSGRRKRDKTLEDRLVAALKKPVKVRIHNRVKSVPAEDAIINGVVNEALRGNLRPLERLMKMLGILSNYSFAAKQETTGENARQKLMRLVECAAEAVAHEHEQSNTSGQSTPSNPNLYRAGREE